MTCAATAKPISSLASADGPTRCASPDGQAIGRSGPAPVHVSRFRARDAGRAMPTNDTSGPLFTASSPSAALQRSLENRLRARMGANGSPEYALTWKHWDMPAGPPICALRASARRTSGSGFSGWPTPTAQDNAQVAGQYATNGTTLAGAARLLGWATPRARDAKGNGVSIARAARGTADSLDLQCKTISRNGTAPLSALSARMDRRALPLNPRFSLWLQGYPVMWAGCAAPVTRSCRRWRRSS